MNDNLHIALFEPRIPQNTGNIARTCAAFNIILDLIHPLGFSLEDKFLKRAGLDYWSYVEVIEHNSFTSFSKKYKNRNIIGFSKSASKKLSNSKFKDDDILLFGREDIGLPPNIQGQCKSMYKIPMPGKADKDGSNGVRSLNLSVAVGIVSYQASIQIGSLID